MVADLMIDLFNQEQAFNRYVECYGDEKRQEGIGIGVERGIGIGREEGIVLSICNLMASVGWSAPQAMDALKIPVSEREKYAVLV